MSDFGLNQRQQRLLRQLVDFVQRGKVKEPIVPIPFGEPTEFVIHIRGEESFHFRYISDLDALCDAGLMDFRWSRQGLNKLYYLTKQAFTAVKRDLQAQKPSPLGYDVNLSELIQAMSGGRLHIPTLNPTSTLSHIAHDPVARHTHVDLLADNLLDAIRLKLAWDDFVRYEKTVQQFKQALLFARPDARVIKELAAALAFSPNGRSDLSFSLTVWPYLYPLLLIGAARLEESPT